MQLKFSLAVQNTGIFSSPCALSFCLQVISELSALVEVAKRHADTRTDFERVQAYASKLYHSPAYQLVVNAMLFLVVRPPDV